jgi:hypothetical protein
MPEETCRTQIILEILRKKSYVQRTNNKKPIARNHTVSTEIITTAPINCNQIEIT